MFICYSLHSLCSMLWVICVSSLKLFDKLVIRAASVEDKMDD